MRKLFPILSIIAVVLLFTAVSKAGVTVRLHVNGTGINTYVVQPGDPLICHYPGCHRTYAHYHYGGLVVRGQSYLYGSRYPYYYQRPYSYRPYYYRKYYHPYYQHRYRTYPYYYDRYPGLRYRRDLDRTPS